MLPADSYALYGEVRGVGQQIRSGEMLGTLEQFMHLNTTPKEVGAMLEFLHAHAEPLTDARLMFATMSSNPSLPVTLVALELPNAEVAQKFASELHTFVASVAPSEVEITPEEGIDVKPAPRTRTAQKKRQKTRQASFDADSRNAPPKLSLHIKRSGNLILTSDTKFDFKSLRSSATTPLSDQPHFKTARGRFSSETLFLYFDFGVMQRSMDGIRKKAEAEQLSALEASEREQQNTPNLPVNPIETTSMTAEPTVIVEDAVVMPTPVEIQSGDETSSAVMSSEGDAVGREATPEESAMVRPGEPTPNEAEAPAAPANEFALGMGIMLGSFVFGGRGGDDMKMPGAISLGAGFEGDALALRLLLLNSNDDKPSVIPFMPVLINGPAHAPDAAAVAPADTDIYVNASLDLASMYDRFVGTIKQNHQAQRDAEAAEGRRSRATVNKDDAGATTPLAPQQEPTPTEENAEPPMLAQLAAMEKLLGFKIREDIIGSLGNEVAVSIPDAYMNPPRNSTTAPDASPSSDKPAATEKSLPPPPSSPVVFISLRNKDTLQSLLPRLLTVLGLVQGGATEPSTKSGGVEIMNFGGVALAFIGNYIAAAPDAASLRHVALAYAEGQTLAASENFRRAMSWQPKQVLGQVYVSNGFLKSSFTREMKNVEQSADDESRALLAQYKLETGAAITHVVRNEGDGPLHEVHVPRNLIETFLAYMAVSEKHAPAVSNESFATNTLYMLHGAQMTYKETIGKGRFGSIEELKAAQLLSDSSLGSDAYRIEMNASGDKFEVIATPLMYPDKGRRSFFINESGILRGGDKSGGRASVNDEPLN
jgi:hypothetical protein